MIDLNKLNPMQREAVEYGDGPLLVLAGAGSGKTRVLTYRIARLIEDGTPAWSILAITFTNKAAREMRQRVLDLCGEAAEEAWVSTFHSCCVRILRRDIEKIGYTRSFSIYDDDDSMAVIKRTFKELNIDEKRIAPRAVRATISACKNKLVSYDEWFAESRRTELDAKVLRVMKRYDEQLAASNALDFDDLLVKTLELLTDNPPVLDAYRRRFSNILVDEYQDTNYVQYCIVRKLVNDRRNVCVVGDDDQSIYGWRGADIRNILEFEKDFPGCKVVKLEQNYRSDGNILEAANHIIGHNTGRKQKSLWTEAGAGEKIHVYTALDERDEAYWICKQAERLRGEFGYGGMAILYRTNAQSRVLEEAFVRAGIPYSVYGGMKFYDRKEVRDLLAYLRVLNNPEDNVSAVRILNEPKRGIGDTTQESIQEYARNEGVSVFSALTDWQELGLPKRAAFQVQQFSELLNTLFEMTFSVTPDVLLNAIIEKTGYLEQFKKEDTEENRSRIENIDELRGAIKQYLQGNPEGDLAGFLENVALVTDIDRMSTERSSITLMTLHAAKGLEFPVVFIAGMEENIFPTSRASYDDAAMEEERRLCYVGVTRAMKKLFLVHARERQLYGNRSANPRSQFIDEIPAKYIDDGRRPQQTAYIPRPTRTVGELGIPGVQKGFGKVTTPDYGAKKVVRSAAAGLRISLFARGDRVYHAKYGNGTVQSLAESAQGTKVSVLFDDGTARLFIAESAPLAKINK